MAYLDFVVLVVGLIAGVILIWGVLLATIELVEAEALRLRGADPRAARRRVRLDLGYYLLLSLEFLIAADILGTIARTPTLERLAVLGSLVAIRTVISVFLTREMQEAPAESDGPPPAGDGQ